ncbi:hypothetical protein [Cerasicoccus fimbriatus]|uniref:hypothetical protein n=1 Tax=Cerasicoccus fimbriatus TaxID=3014554 RepID=UPI0022B4C32A|nr:hypothetical protein [Cerasicoccus sp. TK19100]
MHDVEALTEFEQNCYLAYPHTNGFLSNGQVVFGQQAGDDVNLVRYCPETKTTQLLRSFTPKDRNPSEQFLWFDVARETDDVAVNAGHGVYRFSGLINEPDTSPRIAENPAPPNGGQLPSITDDGARILFESRLDEQFGAWQVDVASGKTQKLVQLPWHANHFHHCPHDERWIAFSHEGAAPTIMDRVWGWHGEDAPTGCCLFDQTGSSLLFGHERWCFHRTSCVVVAYGESPGGPRGVYFCSPGGAQPKLISEGDRDWHVNISTDGQWLVTDTTGPHDAPGRGWENAGSTSDILLINATTGERTFVARSRKGDTHPRHPHPAFSPDARWIYFNEADESGALNRVCRVRNPFVS